MYCLEVLDRDEIICASTLVPVQQVDINAGAGDPSPELIEDEIYAAKIKYRATETAQKILKESMAWPQNEDCGLNLVSVENYKHEVKKE